MIPLHRVEDQNKVTMLMKDIREHGWNGAPLVIWEVYGQLITGVHRYAAVKGLGWDDSEVPTIGIDEVFEEADLDFDVVLEENGNPSVDDDDFLRVLNELPLVIRSKYGIDMH